MTDSGSDAAVSLLALIGTTWIICGKSTVSKRSLAYDIISSLKVIYWHMSVKTVV